VVEDAPPPPPKKPKVRVVEDDTRVEAREETQYDVADDRPRRKGSRSTKGNVEEEFNDLPGEKPKLTRKDRRRVRAERRREELEERRKASEEWLLPGVVMATGLALTMGSAALIALDGPGAAVGVAFLLVLSVVWCLVMVPVTVVVLMGVGMLMGIEYGSLGHTLRSLGAIVAITIGIYWAAGGVFGCIGWLLAPCVSFIVGYLLFIKFFRDLDAFEVRASLGAINFVTGVGNFVFLVLVVIGLIAASAANEGMDESGYDDPDDVPAEVAPSSPQPPAGQQREPVDPDDPDDPDDP
jgi:hypothetical protein